jgi:hypothetical protein
MAEAIVKSKITFGCLLILGTLNLAAMAASKIDDETFRLIRQLVSYKNQEIDALKQLVDYTNDCNNVPDSQSQMNRCPGRLTDLQNMTNTLQVKHDVVGQEIKDYLHQHKSEQWIFMGLLLDDKEFGSLVK